MNFGSTVRQINVGRSDGRGSLHEPKLDRGAILSNDQSMTRLASRQRWLGVITIVLVLLSAVPVLAQTNNLPQTNRPTPWLGVSRWQANQTQVVLCGVLSDGPAGKAGLKIDDTIVRIDGHPITSVRVFHQIVDGLPLGKAIAVEILRDEQTMSLNLVPEPMPDDGGTGRWVAAAEQGAAWAMMEMGVRTANLRGDRSFIARDPEAAVAWFQRAMAAGDTAAPLFLARMYLNGEGVQQDDAVAQKYLMLARQNADDPTRTGVRKGLASAASNELAQMCLRERGPNAHPEMAPVFLQDAANHGSPYAMFVLGELAEKGEIVERDVATAIKWYQKAAALGYSRAQEALDRLSPASTVTNLQKTNDRGAGSPTTDDRYLWRHVDGYFRCIGQGVWIETFRDPTSIGRLFTFQEKERTSDYIELHDTTRNMSVRLTRDRFLLKQTHDKDYVLRTTGSWQIVSDNRRDEPAPSR